MKQASPSPQDNTTWLQRRSSVLLRFLPILPWLIFILALAITFALWRKDEARAQEQLQISFNTKVQDMLEMINMRAQSYEDLLRNIQALYSEKQVDKEQFTHYVNALELHKRYAGVSSISYAQLVNASEKESHERWMRQHAFPNYFISPQGMRAQYAPMIYIVQASRRGTTSNKNYLDESIGIDSFMLPEIEHARRLSQESAEVSATAKIPLSKPSLYSSVPSGEQFGFALTLPVYKKGPAGPSPDNVQGWIDVSIKMEEFMQNIFGSMEQDIALEIYDGQKLQRNNLMYSDKQNLNTDYAAKILHKNQRLQVSGRPWTLSFTALPPFYERLKTTRSIQSLGYGLAMSFTLLFSIWLLVRAQANAQHAARKLAQELQARSAVEAGLIASEKRLQEMIDMLPIALYVKDAQSRFIIMNRACEAQFGTSAQSLVGSDGSDFFPAEQVQDCLNVDTAVFLDGRVREFDEAVWHAGFAETRAVHTYKKPIFDEQKRPQYLICMTVDITERTRTEESLRLLEHCVAHMNDVIFITEPIPNWAQWPKIIFINDAFEKQTGYSRAEAVGNTSELLRGPNTSNNELQRISKAMSEWCTIRSEIINYHKNGTEIWMELELVPITDTKGQYKYWVTVARNINHRKQAEQALRASEAMHRAIIDHAPLPMLVSDMVNNQVVYRNQRCAEMFAVGEVPATSMEVQDYFVDVAQAQHLNNLVCENGYVNDYEVMLKDCHGQHFWAIISMVKSQYEGRQSIISSMVNISPIKNIQDQLREAREKADSANTAKSAFLSNMSHEIRTPMNSILGLAYLALATTLDVKQRDYLEKIHLSGQHLLALIDDILDFSKIEAGMFSIEEIEFNLHATVNKLADLMMQRIQAKGLQFHIDIDPSLASDYIGDPLRIAQVLINLIGNALKFTEKGQITLEIKNAPNSDNSTQVHFAVRDTGIGMTAAQLTLLFAPFQQADVSSSRKYGGTGLGLAISKQLVELMHGEIGVSSEIGVGSTFWFTLPLHGHCPIVTPSPSLPSIPVAELIVKAREKLAGCRVLLAEDAPINQQVATELLQSVGIEVAVANDGREALALLQEQKFDCVLMDVQMPNMDGLEATRKIRATPALSSTIVIAMTANASSQDRSLCLSCGMQDFISKPIKPAMLYATLSKWMESPLPPDDGKGDAPELGGDSTGAKLDENADQATINQTIDLSPLTDLIGHDPILIKKFVAMFFDSADTQMQQIQSLLQQASQHGWHQESRSNILRLLNSLRSEACAMGAQEFGALCHLIEVSLDDLLRAKHKFALLEQLLERVKQQMRAQVGIVAGA